VEWNGGIEPRSGGFEDTASINADFIWRPRHLAQPSDQSEMFGEARYCLKATVLIFRPES